MDNEMIERAKRHFIASCVKEEETGRLLFIEKTYAEVATDFASQEVEAAVKAEGARIAGRVAKIADPDTWSFAFSLNEFKALVKELRGEK